MLWEGHSNMMDQAGRGTVLGGIRLWEGYRTWKDQARRGHSFRRDQAAGGA